MGANFLVSRDEHKSLQVFGCRVRASVARLGLLQLRATNRFSSPLRARFRGTDDVCGLGVGFVQRHSFLLPSKNISLDYRRRISDFLVQHVREESTTVGRLQGVHVLRVTARGRR